MLHPSLNFGTAHSMRPLRPLYVPIFIAQVAGGAGGLGLARYPAWFENLWASAALLTLPGYLAGRAVQRKTFSAALQAQRNTVRRIRFAAAMLSVAVFFMPFGQ